MSRSAFLPVDDGYTETVYMGPRVARNGQVLYGSLTFDRRPLRPIQRARIYTAASKSGLTEEESVIAYAQLCAKRIIRWDAIDPDTNKPLEISERSILRRMHPEAQARLFSIVVHMTDPGDPIPGKDGDVDETKSIDAVSWLDDPEDEAAQAADVEGDQKN